MENSSLSFPSNSEASSLLKDTQKNPISMKNKSSPSKSAVVNAVAGACAGCLAKTIVAPIERVKLVMQLRGSIDKNSAHQSVSAFRVAADVFRTQGALAFWRGNTPNVIRQGGTAALNFMLMDSYKIAISPLIAYTLTFPSQRTHPERLRHRARISSFLSGGLAGGTVTTVLYPIEFLRTRLALDMGNSIETRKYPNGMRDVFIATYKVDGIRGMYQGYGIAVAGVILYKGLHLGGYDAMKNEILHYQNKHNHDSSQHDKVKLTMTQRFMAAQAVSIVAGTICYPIDSVRRRLMMQAGLPTFYDRPYKNSFDCFKKVAMEEGLKGFYLGIGPNLLRSFGGALLLVGYDTFKGMII